VRDAALRSVLAIEDARLLGPWLEQLARSAPFTVRTTAQQALQEARHA
jgi:hypothetical protein